MSDLATPRKKANFNNAWIEARELAWHHRQRLTIGLSLMLVGQLASLVMPWCSKILIDDVIGKRQVAMLGPIALYSGLATLVQAITSFANSQVLGVAAQAAISDMRKRVQHHVSLLPVRYFDSTQTGVLISRVMNDAEGIRNLVGTGLVQLLGGLITAVIGLGVLFWLNWHLTTLMLLVLGAFGGVMAVAFAKLRPLFRERGKIQGEVTGRLTETIGGIRIVKAYTAEKRERLVFARGAHRLLRNVAGSMTGVSGITAFSIIIVGSIGVLMTLIGGRAIIDGRMTLGEFFMYIFFTGLVAGPLVQIASVGTQITEALAGLDRIHELLNTSTEVDEERSLAPVDQVRGDVRFEDVTFEYVADVPVLRGITFDVPAGTTTALVGSSGSGKSTIISLVLAFNRPKRGRVMLDGRDLTQLRLRDYRQFLGVVLQENFLFDGTVSDNIRFSRPDARPEEIREAARIAHCDEFIMEFPNGYDSVVGERGIRLSGGQRQRIAIARAILANSRILILDEATSSLDSESEAQIQDGLRALRRGRTSFVIAHRLSTIRTADQILVIEHGEVVERGSHEQLIARGGRYRELYDRQYQIETDRFINPGEDFTPDLPTVTVPAAGREGTAAPRT
ncbi:MAG: ABC transporter ATP-binding protein [Candidatus Eisenbacteria bacterium]|uniref:ABC transporter ATP-binding protein n=1 Tax=Eiseniibacteriota bacterium TaxID=2212470 RepID=A0A849SMW7_UNCEI|nr:ABC transporter ATP-binding protein [Candidatus Eisenbacteria bacterium]